MSVDTSSSGSPGGVAVVLGTRPEVIKLARIVSLLGPEARLLHTGQHYDEQLSRSFFAEYGIAEPALQLQVGGLRRGAQVGGALTAIDEHLARHRPAVVLVQGDTNATLAGALAANAAEVPLVHVEAGLRSHDPAMPEEHNRIVADHLSQLRCAATASNVANLAAEGITDGVVVTGNTVVEAVQHALPAPDQRRGVLHRHSCTDGQYVLATIHRPENTDDPDRLASILRALGGCGRQVVVPLHPRTQAAVEAHGLGGLLQHLRVVPPVSSGEFLALAAHAALLVSDSGGVQEECTVLKRPLVVVRNSTERPESLDAFARLVQPDGAADAIAEVLTQGPDLLRHLAELPSPYGDGRASERIVAELGTWLPERRSGAA